MPQQSDETWRLPPSVGLRTARAARGALRLLRLYHRHSVRGMEHVPPSGAALLVVHHTLATYDIGLLGMAVFEATGRLPRALADRLFFRLPPLGAVVHNLGGVQGSMAEATALLEAGALVMVAPGGMREAMRPSRARYQISWEGRLGFARLALATGVPLVLAACPAADALYDVAPSRLSDWALRHAHLPLPLARGLLGTALPRPLRLTHVVAPPIRPPPRAAEGPAREAQAVALQAECAATMRQLLAQGR